MSKEKLKPAKEQGRPAPSQVVPLPPAKPVTPPLLRKIDWLTFGITTLVVFIGYYLTLAPDLTLEDSGELAVGSQYAGVPHPPGYPVWTIFTWLFTVLVPVSNIAWRVALASAVSGALACGLIALLASRGSSMILEGIDEFKTLDRRWENALCVLAGYVAGLLIGFNGFMWSQAVIVEVYPFSLLSFVGVLCCLLRWIYAPHQRRYLYWAMFLFGICFTNHMTLIVAAMGIEVAIIAAQPKLGRDLMLGNSVVFLVGLALKANGKLTGFENKQLFSIYLAIGTASLAAWVWLAAATMKKLEDWMALLRDVLMFLGVLYWAYLIAAAAKVIPPDMAAAISRSHLIGLGIVLGFVLLVLSRQKDKAAGALPAWGYAALALTAFYLLTLLTTATGKTNWSNRTPAVFLAVNLAGTVLVALSGWALMRVRKFGTVVFPIATLAGLWVLGAAFYFYMPLASMTNPPLNWGYPRTWDGFLHALTRGQYEKTNPTANFGRFMDQMAMLLHGAVDEFNLVYLLVGLIPFFFFRRMQKREQGWFAGLVAMYLGLALLLIMLLNPSSDRQSKELNRVFFTASHVMISLCVAYGMTLFGALMATQYGRYRMFGWVGGSAATAIALYTATVVFQSDKDSLLSSTGAALFGVEPSHYRIHRLAAVFSFGLAALVTAIFLAARQRAPMVALLFVYGLMPLKSVLSHWSENEQRGHLFGYWFGHDMFTPPFVGPDGRLSYDPKLRGEALKGSNGKLVYPEMARDAILFGGTDPGRFCPTYMIFSESFVPEKCKPRDPNFNRRDVYIITQNALADGTYLEYIRAHYNRSAQIDAPFFQGMFLWVQDLLQPKTYFQRGTTNYFAQLAAPLDRYFTSLGKRIEDRRRHERVYPPAEIITPSPDDSQRSFNEYMIDAEQRLRAGQLKPGEDVKIDRESGRMQVSGQVAVMSINGLLTKVIFEKNPTNEFYVEESFPLDWMYSYLEPFGIIMRINRQPLPELSEEIVKRDHEFWSQYSQRLIGNWITYDTPVKDICEFAGRVYERHDYKGFTGDRKFIRDDQAQKSFSKLRSSIGGIYAWRYQNAKTPAERQRMFKEADFAFRQAFAFCPFSPEAISRYAYLLANERRLDDAERIAETALRFDQENPFIQSLLNQIKGAKQSQGQLTQTQEKLGQLELQFKTNPGDARVAFELSSLYLQLQQSNASFHVLDQLINSPQADTTVLLSVAGAYAQLKQGARLEGVLQRLVKLAPENPEAWYDLATTQAQLGKNNEALQSLGKALNLSAQRLAKQPKAPDLRRNAATNQSFASIHNRPEFQKLVAQQ